MRKTPILYHSTNNGARTGDDCSTEADFDYFNGDLAGLGLGGGDVSNPSPSAMEMIKQIQGGVNLYNGTQNTTIPLHTLTNSDVNLPISLSSSNNGLKVNDLGSVVGQNWSVNAAPMITRVVKGIPDDFQGVLRGEGKGHITRPQFVVDIPSDIGFRFDFPGASTVGCPAPLDLQARVGLHSGPGKLQRHDREG